MFWSVRRKELPSSSAERSADLEPSESASFSVVSTEMIASMMLPSGVRSSRDIFSMKSFLSRSIFPSFSFERSSSMSCAKRASESFSTSSLLSSCASRRGAVGAQRLALPRHALVVEAQREDLGQLGDRARAGRIQRVRRADGQRAVQVTRRSAAGG